MFNLFKKSTQNKVVELKNNFNEKTTNQIIEEIHDSFYTEVDRLLADAKIANSLNTDKQHLIAKCEKLKALGFTNTNEVKEAQSEISRLQALEQENIKKADLIEAINYFSFKYPNYKFITEESVKKICEKYNLVYSESKNYIGTVPDKNLKQMEDFKIDENDVCFMSITQHISFQDHRVIKYIPFETYNNTEKQSWHRSSLTNLSACPLEIVAPLKDFDMQGMEVKDFKISTIEVPDPVVLKPVIFKDKKHYLIVTAWGLEASDELVVNQKMN